MRHIIAAAAALAVCGLLASTSARAEPLFEPGGPVKVGNMCKVAAPEAAINGGYGYMAPCPNEPAHYAKRTKKMKS